MSESDETGVLLLIPPDFFAVDTSSSELLSGKCDLEENQENFIPLSSTSGYSNKNTLFAMESETGNVPFEDYCDKHFESNLDFYRPSTKDHLLNEIDSFLGHKTTSIHTQAPNDSFLDGNFQIDLHEMTRNEQKAKEDPMDVPLISLGEIWKKDNKVDAPNVLEEQLRRKHLEKTLESVQKTLMEYQQKIAVALKVDKLKGEVIGRLKQNVRDLKHKLSLTESLPSKLHYLELENIELRKKGQLLELELEKGLGLAKQCQERNEILEEKVNHLTTATNDIKEINKKQIEDLQIRLSNSIKSEQILNDDLVKARNQILLEKKCHKDNQDLWSKKEKNLQLELDSIRNSMKHFYQGQVDDVVSRKLTEFQKQMDEAESGLKMDYMRRERQIAEKAAQQMELIFKKNELELHLIQEKHKEEIKFYKLQLESAQTVIEDAKDRLASFQTQHTLVEERTGIMKDDFDASKFKKSLLFSTPQKQQNDHHHRPKDHSPELQNYIEMLLKKSPKSSPEEMGHPYHQKKPLQPKCGFPVSPSTNSSKRSPWR